MQDSNFTIREVTKEDAQQVVDLMNRIDTQTKFMLYEPGERPTTTERIKEICDSDNDNILLAEVDGVVAAYLLMFRQKQLRKKHRLALVLAVDEEFQKMGLAAQLLQNAIDWSKENGIHRIELTVRTDNTIAHNLYKKLGFEEEGVSRHTTKVDGKYYDDYVMAMLV